MIKIIDYLEWFVIAFPLLGALTNGLVGKRLSRRAQNWIACGAVAGSLLVMLPLFFGQAMEPGLIGRSKVFPWITVWSGDNFVQGAFRLRIDALSMLIALTTIVTSLFIHLFIAQNAAEDPARHFEVGGHDGQTRGGRLEIHDPERFDPAHVQKTTGAAKQRRHP